MIPVTKPFLPTQTEYQSYIDKIWNNSWLTNMGPLSRKLEHEIGDLCKTKTNPLFVTNGTIALQMAIKSIDGLENDSEIITTPFSFVATTSSIVWENAKPVFVDISSKTLNIDPTLIENAITSKTKAILVTHVYGNPCNVEDLRIIAEKHKLTLIYDAAHAFGVKHHQTNESIFSKGDISTCSLHSTKLFHSIEGGLIFATPNRIKHSLQPMRNFGIAELDSFSCLGINGKNSEFHAAMGLTNLPYLEKIISKRKLLSDLYDSVFIEHSSDLKKPLWNSEWTKNYAYYPVIFQTEEQLIRVQKRLEKAGISIRRYFYPSLATLPYVENPGNLNITDIMSKKIACLPLYYDLSEEEVIMIANLIKEVI